LLQTGPSVSLGLKLLGQLSGFLPQVPCPEPHEPDGHEQARGQSEHRSRSEPYRQGLPSGCAFLSLHTPPKGLPFPAQGALADGFFPLAPRPEEVRYVLEGRGARIAAQKMRLQPLDVRRELPARIGDQLVLLEMTSRLILPFSVKSFQVSSKLVVHHRLSSFPNGEALGPSERLGSDLHWAEESAQSLSQYLPRMMKMSLDRVDGKAQGDLMRRLLLHHAQVHASAHLRRQMLYGLAHFLQLLPPEHGRGRIIDHRQGVRDLALQLQRMLARSFQRQFDRRSLFCPSPLSH